MIILIMIDVCPNLQSWICKCNPQAQTRRIKVACSGMKQGPVSVVRGGSHFKEDVQQAEWLGCRSQ